MSPPSVGPTARAGRPVAGGAASVAIRAAEAGRTVGAAVLNVPARPCVARVRGIVGVVATSRHRACSQDHAKNESLHRGRERVLRKRHCLLLWMIVHCSNLTAGFSAASWGRPL